MSTLKTAAVKHPSSSGTAITLDASDNVGIGTATPSSLLDVDKSQDAETNIQLTNTNTGSSAQVRTKYTTDGGLFTVGKTSDAHPYGGDAYIYNVDNTNIRFATNDIERLRILSSGGITFNGDTAAANALDDYEEGTWTPTVNYGTLNFKYGNYRKIGNKVWVNFFIQGFSDTTTNTSIRVSSLPFSSTAATANGAAGAVWSQYTSATPAATYVSTSTVYFYKNGGTGAHSALKYTDISSGTNCAFYGEATYLT